MLFSIVKVINTANIMNEIPLDSDEIHAKEIINHVHNIKKEILDIYNDAQRMIEIFQDEFQDRVNEYKSIYRVHSFSRKPPGTIQFFGSAVSHFAEITRHTVFKKILQNLFLDDMLSFCYHFYATINYKISQSQWLDQDDINSYFDGNRHFITVKGDEFNFDKEFDLAPLKHILSNDFNMAFIIETVENIITKSFNIEKANIRRIVYEHFQMDLNSHAHIFKFYTSLTCFSKNYNLQAKYIERGIENRELYSCSSPSPFAGFIDCFFAFEKYSFGPKDINITKEYIKYKEFPYSRFDAYKRHELDISTCSSCIWALKSVLKYSCTKHDQRIVEIRDEYFKNIEPLDKYSSNISNLGEIIEILLHFS